MLREGALSQIGHRQIFGLVAKPVNCTSTIAPCPDANSVLTSLAHYRIAPTIDTKSDFWYVTYSGFDIQLG